MQGRAPSHGQTHTHTHTRARAHTHTLSQKRTLTLQNTVTQALTTSAPLAALIPLRFSYDLVQNRVTVVVAAFEVTLLQILSSFRVMGNGIVPRW